MTMGDNEWVQVTMSNKVNDSEWQLVTKNDNEKQQMTASGTAKENGREKVKQSDFKF